MDLWRGVSYGANNKRQTFRWFKSHMPVLIISCIVLPLRIHLYVWKSSLSSATLMSSLGWKKESLYYFSTSHSVISSTAQLACLPSSPYSTMDSFSETNIFLFWSYVSWKSFFSVVQVPSAPSQLAWEMWSPMLTYSPWYGITLHLQGSRTA